MTRINAAKRLYQQLQKLVTRSEEFGSQPVVQLRTKALTPRQTIREFASKHTPAINVLAPPLPEAATQSPLYELQRIRTIKETPYSTRRILNADGQTVAITHERPIKFGKETKQIRLDGTVEVKTLKNFPNGTQKIVTRKWVNGEGKSPFDSAIEAVLKRPRQLSELQRNGGDTLEVFHETAKGEQFIRRFERPRGNRVFSKTEDLQE